MTRTRPNERIVFHNAGPFRWWRVDMGSSTYWHLQLRVGRIGLHWNLMQHRHPTSDRWVWQSTHHYDCKAAK